MTDLDDELQFHLERRIAELMEQGRSRSDAERIARERFGDVQGLAHYSRRLDRWATLRSGIAAVPSDMRHAVRSLVRARGFAATAVLTLTCALVLCITVLTAVNVYLVRGLPYPHADRLFNVTLSTPPQVPPRQPETFDWASLNDIVELPISWDLDLFNLRGAPYSEAVNGTWVTPGYLSGFGIQPVMGRTFAADDFDPARPAVALISHRLWQTRFGGDPGVIGQPIETFSMDRPEDVASFTVVGVLAEDFWHMNTFTDILSPLRAPSVPYMVRLREGVSPGRAADRITALVRAAQDMPADWHASLDSTQATYVNNVRPLLLSLSAASALVLLIAVANVSVLLLVRATARHREIVVRKALGASRLQIARGVIAEAVILGAVVTAAAVAVSHLVLTALAPHAGRQLGRGVPGGAAALQLDDAALWTAILGGLTIVVVSTVVPLWAARGAPAAGALSAGQKGASAGPAQQRTRAVMIVIEVAASLALLVGAALMVQSGMRMLATGLGIDARHVRAGMLGVNRAAYPDIASQVSFRQRIESALAMPIVRSVAFTNTWPLQAPPTRDVAALRPGGGVTTRAGLVGMSDRYFEALGIAITDGRGFTPEDRQGQPLVAVVSASLAAQLWPEQRAVGQRLRVEPPPNTTDEAPRTYDVVGVVGDTRHTHTDDQTADMYVPLSQVESPGIFLYVTTHGPAPAIEPAIRSALGTVDPNLVLAMPRVLEDIVDQQRAAPRFLARVLVVFAALAATLALVGISGVIAYTVRQRRREIAVRMAIGADTRTITTLFVRHGLVTLGTGLTLGLVGATALGHVLRSQLFGVNVSDPWLLTVVTCTFAVCGLLAVVWPARAAASVDPADALKD